MTKKYRFEIVKRSSNTNYFSILILLITCFSFQTVWSQNSNENIKGIVLESGTGRPLEQALISVTSTGISSETDDKGVFTISVPHKQVELIIDLPGYNKRIIHLNGRDLINVSLVSSGYSSFDNSFNNPLGKSVLKDANFSVTALTADNLKFSMASSFDQALQGRVSGLSVIEQSGMPGHKTFMNIRGISSLYGKTEPLLFVDGMIHDYSYANNSLMEGFAVNPLEVIDISDISDISILKDGVSFLGASGSNGIINVNTEQKSETSTVIQMSAYGGISMVPQSLHLLNSSEFRNYFTDIYNSNPLNSVDIDTKFPWLHGNPGTNEYYRYNNSTDWQKSTYKPSTFSKYHFFLKGGDDIATYNISTGYVHQKGLFEESGYSKFNLRINGKINISDKFSITPNAKLSLADSKLPNLGYSTWKNPLISSLLMPPIMDEYARDNSTGTALSYIDDVGAFNVSNPKALVKNGMGTSRNYQFLSSVNVQYKFNERFLLSNLVGIDYNNSRENIFLPDIGVVNVDSASNSPGDFVNEFRSSQNHAMLIYNNKIGIGHSILVHGGIRYMKNNYKNDKAIDLNTPSDDFKSLGQGSKYSFLRTLTGDNRGLVWISYFGSLNYNIRDRYLVDANLSYDGNSAVNAENRYNFYPSVALAWRASSEKFLSHAKWIEDLKFRASWSVVGNMFSNVYDFSKLYYVSRKVNSIGLITREAIPNNNMKLEKKNTVNAGVDFSLFRQVLNVHVDYYQSNVNNLIIRQKLPQTFGYTTNYFDNGGKLQSEGVEISADARLHIGRLVWIVGSSMTKQMTKIRGLEFINQATSNIITPIEGGEYITSVGNAVNAFYGYKTNGIFSNGADASQYTGPNGKQMQAGDVNFIDTNSDNVINEKDKQIIGNPNPKLFGGINTTLSYEKFEFTALFTYSVGNDIFNYVRYKAESMDSYGNQLASVLDRWTPTNTSGKLPRASIGDPTGNTVFSDRWIEDGTYIRLKQLTLNYHFPSMSGVYKGLTLYLTATNLITFTKYTGYDPDFLYSNNPFYMGVDYGKMPQSRAFLLGLKLDL
ncbi:MAG: SusC/RagA family TonB-linked outer membrane protein [Prolixibacteraceae bacterium]|nr:SusC/RagA family TonB-linked outer membrane protein [Prolixibacteraceae bacterium]